MRSAVILLRLRRLLLGFSALLFVGTVIELWLTEHTDGVVQLIPFALCGVGLVAVLVVLIHPQPVPVLGLRVCMGVVVLGSLFGVYEHIENNIAFEREIHPNAPTGDIVMGALGGANPLLAPGILAVAAMLAMGATYQQSAFGKSIQE